MSKTFKDKLKKEHYKSRIRLGKKLKLLAKKKRKALRLESNPLALRRGSADEWSIL